MSETNSKQNYYKALQKHLLCLSPEQLQVFLEQGIKANAAKDIQKGKTPNLEAIKDMLLCQIYIAAPTAYMKLPLGTTCSLEQGYILNNL